MFKHFALPVSFFWSPNVTDLNFLCYILFFFFYWVGSLSFVNFWQTCCFWILFFPFIFLLNMTSGANTKKIADDISSNDRGDDEGIFCFFQSSTLVHDFISVYLSVHFFHLSLLFLPVLKTVHLSVPLSLFSSCMGTTVIFIPSYHIDDWKSLWKEA